MNTLRRDVKYTTVERRSRSSADAETRRRFLTVCEWWAIGQTCGIYNYLNLTLNEQQSGVDNAQMPPPVAEAINIVTVNVICMYNESLQYNEKQFITIITIVLCSTIRLNKIYMIELLIRVVKNGPVVRRPPRVSLVLVVSTQPECPLKWHCC